MRDFFCKKNGTFSTKAHGKQAAVKKQQKTTRKLLGINIPSYFPITADASIPYKFGIF